MKKFLNLFKRKEKKKEKKRFVGLFRKPVKTNTVVLNDDKSQSTPNNTPENSSESESRKKAILIGLNYPGSLYTLNGCVNDVKNGNDFLKEHGYESRFLDDSQVSNTYDVLEALEELRKSDSLVVFFHYSGHGTQVADTNTDELDGKDETVYSKDGHLITDDEINSKLAEFPANKIVFLIFDCCHSGTICDLPYIAVSEGIKEEKVKKPIKAKVICVSGCRDNQTSADITEGGISYGALSATLYSILRKNEKDNKSISWRDLYNQLLLEMSKKRYAQIPQLTASDPSLFNQIVRF